MIVMSRASSSSSPTSFPLSTPPPKLKITTQATMHTRKHVLIPRQNQPTGAGGTQSLTFGFAFMGVLLFLLFFAHMMQRVASRRQREVLGRMAALQDAREMEEVPKVWDVRVESIGSDECIGQSEREGKRDGEEGSGNVVEGRGTRVRKGERWRWKDVQPVSADPVIPPPEDTDLQTSSGPHDRLQPLRVAMIIAMPMPMPNSSSAYPSTKHTDSTNYPDEADAGLPYIELGVTTIKGRIHVRILFDDSR